MINKSWLRAATGNDGFTNVLTPIFTSGTNFFFFYSQVGRPEKCRSVSAGGAGTATLADRHSYAEGRVPAPHGPPPSPGAAAAQRKVAAACLASRRLLEDTLAKSGKLYMSWETIVCEKHGRCGVAFGRPMSSSGYFCYSCYKIDQLFRNFVISVVSTHKLHAVLNYRVNK